VRAIKIIISGIFSCYSLILTVTVNYRLENTRYQARWNHQTTTTDC
jgi:hypothetical protein